MSLLFKALLERLNQDAKSLREDTRLILHILHRVAVRLAHKQRQEAPPKILVQRINTVLHEIGRLHKLDIVDERVVEDIIGHYRKLVRSEHQQEYEHAS